MRTDELRDTEKKVDTVLVKHANKHQAEFMEGMQLLGSISHGEGNDISAMKQICQETRANFDHMK